MIQVPSASSLLDRLRRPLIDFRVSVTDRCNFRCTYCMPRSEVGTGYFLPKKELLSFEELSRVVSLAVGLGVKKVRLTGGEPLTRRDLPRLVALLRPHGAELALTTNGVLLPELARPLRDAGLDRITVSLDSLSDATFQQMADAPAYSPADVVLGIEAALEAGFETVKVNVVVKRDVNSGEIPALVEKFRGRPVVLRFIEFMDVGSRNGWAPSAVFSKAEILSAIGADFQAEARPARSPATYYRNPSSGQRVGVIASVTEPFCGDCSRLRLTSDGRLFTCLFGSSGLELREPLRGGSTDDALLELIRSAWRERSDRYSEQREESQRLRLPVLGRVEMSTIGG